MNSVSKPCGPDGTRTPVMHGIGTWSTSGLWSAFGRPMVSGQSLVSLWSASGQPLVGLWSLVGQWSAFPPHAPPDAARGKRLLAIPSGDVSGRPLCLDGFSSPPPTARVVHVALSVSRESRLEFLLCSAFRVCVFRGFFGGRGLGFFWGVRVRDLLWSAAPPGGGFVWLLSVPSPGGGFAWLLGVPPSQVAWTRQRL